MDFASIAIAAATALSPYFIKAAEKFVETAGEKLGEKAAENHGKIYEIVKGALIGDEIITLNLLEENPESKDLQKIVAKKLEPRLKENPEIARQLDELIKQLPAQQASGNVLTITGDNNKTVQGVSGSTINIS